MLSADFIISAKLWLLFPKIKILSSAEHSDVHMKHLRLIYNFFGVSSASTVARLFVTFTSFALCCYVIGLLNRKKQNHKHNRKECCSDASGSFFAILGERCVISQETAAAKETRLVTDLLWS